MLKILVKVKTNNILYFVSYNTMLKTFFSNHE